MPANSIAEEASKPERPRLARPEALVLIRAAGRSLDLGMVVDPSGLILSFERALAPRPESQLAPDTPLEARTRSGETWSLQPVGAHRGLVLLRAAVPGPVAAQPIGTGPVAEGQPLIAVGRGTEESCKAGRLLVDSGEFELEAVGRNRVLLDESGSIVGTCSAPPAQMVWHLRWLVSAAAEGRQLRWPPSPSGVANTLVRIGDERWRLHNDAAGAMSAFSEALRFDPHCAVAYFRRGALLIGKGDHAGAQAEYSSALAVEPDWDQVLYARARSRDHEGAFDAAMADYDAALKVNPFSGKAWFWRGRLHHRKNHLEHALSDYTAAVDLNEKDAMAYAYRGLAYREAKHTEAARADLWHAAGLAQELNLKELLDLVKAQIQTLPNPLVKPERQPGPAKQPEPEKPPVPAWQPVEESALPAHRHKVFIDTCSLMKPNAEAFFLQWLEPQFATAGTLVLLTMDVITELQRHLLGGNAEKRKLAEAADRLLAPYLADSRIRVLPKNPHAATLADNTYLELLQRYCLKYDQTLVTNDRDLAYDALDVLRRRSVHTNHSIIVVCVGLDGRALDWSEIRRQQDERRRRAAENPRQAAPGPNVVPGGAQAPPEVPKQTPGGAQAAPEPPIQVPGGAPVPPQASKPTPLVAPGEPEAPKPAPVVAPPSPGGPKATPGGAPVPPEAPKPTPLVVPGAPEAPKPAPVVASPSPGGPKATPGGVPFPPQAPKPTPLVVPGAPEAPKPAPLASPSPGGPKQVPGGAPVPPQAPKQVPGGARVLPQAPKPMPAGASLVPAGAPVPPQAPKPTPVVASPLPGGAKQTPAGVPPGQQPVGSPKPGLQRPAAPPPFAPAFAISTGPVFADQSPLPLTLVCGTGDVLKTAAGESMQLGPRLGGGGEGAVYLTADPNRVCKVYGPAPPRVSMRKKLELMCSRPLTHTGLCWPQQMVFNARGEFAGYTMSRGSGKPLQNSIMQPRLLLDLFPQWERRQLLELAVRILRTIEYLNRNNILLGDINPNNVLVQDEKTVSFVDTDSYQIGNFPCPVGLPPFVHPDLLGQDLRSRLRGPEHENFAISTLVFMLLMPGKPPYSHQGGEGLVVNVLNGHFPYKRGKMKPGQGVPRGPWGFIWSHFPEEIREEFHCVFTDGQQRTAADWIPKLRRYLLYLGSPRCSAESRQIFPKGYRLLPKEVFERNKGTWQNCVQCGQGFGRFADEKEHHGLCLNCRIRLVQVPCRRCKTPVTETLERYYEREKAGFTCAACREILRRPRAAMN